MENRELLINLLNKMRAEFIQKWKLFFERQKLSKSSESADRELIVFLKDIEPKRKLLEELEKRLGLTPSGRPVAE